MIFAFLADQFFNEIALLLMLITCHASPARSHDRALESQTQADGDAVEEGRVECLGKAAVVEFGKEA